jgi:uncharacterized protein YsxB (DUF464 family)
MTIISFTKNKANEIIGFRADGHTNYGVEGEDIVCAGVSSIVQTAGLGIFTVAQVQANIKRDDKRGLFELTLPKSLTVRERHDCNIILETMVAGLADLYETYSDFIELEGLK